MILPARARFDQLLSWNLAMPPFEPGAEALRQSRVRIVPAIGEAGEGSWPVAGAKRWPRSSAPHQLSSQPTSGRRTTTRRVADTLCEVLRSTPGSPAVWRRFTRTHWEEFVQAKTAAREWRIDAQRSCRRTLRASESRAPRLLLERDRRYALHQKHRGAGTARYGRAQTTPGAKRRRPSVSEVS
jgi:hypothetical protein